MTGAEIFASVGFLLLLVVVAAMSIEFGDKQMSVLDRWKGVRHQWAKDHHGID
ncbi:hypothetical protein [Kineosporia sp. A_224]|uniref:hypothetical protein n=1 Tax=Kineosporia sp. A_224 TaxID=1962180 RepID=UPI00130463C1|nr:hypothetical protein [Kineosporia sp. A_224]